MIVNHGYKFIFLKTRKTAGTSIEIALSQFCGPDDIITKMTPEDENERQRLGFRGPQNYKVPLKNFRVWDLLSARWIKTRELFFHPHTPAWLTRPYLGEKVWNSYFKFCFERNPFDKALSRYSWSTRKMDRPLIEDYLKSAPIYLLSNWSIYTIDKEIAVDFVGRYESLTENLSIVMKKIGLPIEINLPRAKDTYREDRRHYNKVLNVQARARIEEVCAKEIAAFSYGWEEEFSGAGSRTLIKISAIKSSKAPLVVKSKEEDQPPI